MRVGTLKSAPAIFLRATALAGMLLMSALAPVRAETLAYRLSLTEAVAGNPVLEAFYEARDQAPLWTGPDGAPRRAALIAALRAAGDHGLPAGRHDANDLLAALGAASSDRDLGAIEARMSAALLAYARDVHSGVLAPSQVSPEMVRTVTRPDPARILADFAAADPVAFLRSLPPQTPEYARLMRQRHRLLDLTASYGWGPEVPGAKLELGDRGEAVIALRNRLIAMGYMARTASQDFDAPLQAAVIAFQTDHGLSPDGVVGAGTIAAINTSPQKRLESVIVAMERERWMNFDRGQRHIWVNLADYSAKIIDDGKVTLQTRAVVGANARDRRSPEFSDEMTHLIINPTWHVPRSIATKEYLPELQNDPNAVSHLDLFDRSGRRVDRASIDFTEFTTSTFPFLIKQGPGDANALGKVKFMFPNRWNIYLHDTPQKYLFSREARAFSHGCIRLNDPFDFAYTLLARQVDDPESYFRRILETGRETRVDLAVPVPVHLVYRTAIMPARGKPQYRADIYGRDAEIFEALTRAGVALPVPQS
jgi:murein L,D-transpeptidase YcbB/YkuD